MPMLFSILPFIGVVVWFCLVIYIITLLRRLVIAVEKIAEK